MGAQTPKAFIPLGPKLLYQHSLDVFQGHPQIQEIVLVVPPHFLDKSKEESIQIVAGGLSRQESVAHGLETLSETCDVCLVHDAARPFITNTLIDRLIDQLERDRSVIPAIPLSDTIKWVEERRILKTVDRKNLWGAQTPQGFQVTVLKEAFQKALENDWSATDEASLLEKIGAAVYTVEGDPLNIKITSKQDLELARIIYANRSGL